MGIIDGIEKLINEHGSSVILSQQLALAKEQFTALERRLGDLQSKLAKTEAQLEIERATHQKTGEELQRLKDEHAEEVRISGGVEFRRSRRTGGQWLAFCPRCHVPLQNHKGVTFVTCTEKCGWQSLLNTDDLRELASDL